MYFDFFKFRKALFKKEKVESGKQGDFIPGI